MIDCIRDLVLQQPRTISLHKRPACRKIYSVGIRLDIHVETPKKVNSNPQNPVPIDLGTIKDASVHTFAGYHI